VDANKFARWQQCRDRFQRFSNHHLESRAIMNMTVIAICNTPDDLINFDEIYGILSFDGDTSQTLK
jgi:hypothetical protein